MVAYLKKQGDLVSLYVQFGTRNRDMDRIALSDLICKIHSKGEHPN